MLIKPYVLKKEDKYTKMTKCLVRHRTDAGWDYWSIQAIWNWSYSKTLQMYKKLPTRYKTVEVDA